MWLERCYSTHAVAHVGGNKTHRAKEEGGGPWCGSRMAFGFSNATSGVEVTNRTEARNYIDCERCLLTVPERVGR